MRQRVFIQLIRCSLCEAGRRFTIYIFKIPDKAEVFSFYGLRLSDERADTDAILSFGLTIRENESTCFINQHWKGRKVLITYEAELLLIHFHLCICRNHIEHLSSGNLSDLTQSMSKCLIYCFPCALRIPVKFIPEIVCFGLDYPSSNNTRILQMFYQLGFQLTSFNVSEWFNEIEGYLVLDFKMSRSKFSLPYCFLLSFCPRCQHFNVIFYGLWCVSP